MCLYAVYRATCASRTDTDNLITSLETLIQIKMPCIMTGDFNMELTDCINPSVKPCNSIIINDAFQAFVDFNALDELVQDVTRGSSLLYLVLVASTTTKSDVINTRPLASSDHKGQPFSVVATFVYLPERTNCVF